ncbi:MAG TPA: IS110 family transposase [bacterium]
MRSNLSKRTGIINNQTLIVTVDIGKSKHTGYGRCPDGTEIPTFEFFNNGRGFTKFWAKVKAMIHDKQLTEAIVGFESTGPYAEPLMHFLSKKGVRLVQVNGAHTKKAKEIFDNSPNKTDAKDPNVIADLLELGRFLSVVIPEGSAAELRRLSHARERHLERLKTLYNQLHALVFLMFPEFLEVMKKLKTKSSRHLLEIASTPQAILALGCDELTRILRRVSHGRLAEKRAQALYVAASESVGLVAGQKGMVAELEQLLQLIALCESSIAQLEQQLAEELKAVPYSRCLLSIKGVGVVTVAGLIGEVGEFSNFTTIDQLMKYAGLNLYELSSGRHQGRRRISKRGRPLMRKLLYFATLNVVHKGGILHRQYQSYLQRGMPRLKALVAICRKLLGIMFALVRDHSEYQTEYSNYPLLKQAA